MGYDIEKEKREAIEAGQRALSSLRTAKENLNSAKNWGLVDMFGGGFFSTMLKHSKMDQARQNMEQAKYDLRNFSRELNDVNMACNLNINTGDFLSFADYFFDGYVAVQIDRRCRWSGENTVFFCTLPHLSYFCNFQNIKVVI